MHKNSSQVESLFAAAAELSGEARNSFLDRECADEELRGELEGLLRAHDRVNHVIDRPIIQDDMLQATCLADAQAVGTVVAGRYKLLELIGEGGMGTVWVAEQTEPVRRKVALKLIKAGMDSKAVLARFEAERQALAMMDHPNIAKVLDGGMTETGRPYFVMEYVKGFPITEYCDSMKLSLPERLDLFIQVCSAVQHAHQKGIIHRDLKPSNILVAPYDDKPVPKVIDFGLAKALHQRLTERTIHTAHETVIGTPLYMSPEQAQLNNLDVDTRSDIYSLGVLLYELLTGTTPLEKARFKEAAWDEIRRIIREEEPPRPSTRLSSTGTLPSLAACRQTEPVKLAQQLKGELDWIVMKALEKERTRRYETANGLAADVKRFLENEPVVARPPSTAYRLQKAYRRNKTAFVASAAVAVALLAGISVSLWQAARATRSSIAAKNSWQAEIDARRIAEIASAAADDERSRKEMERDRADRVALAARHRAYASDMNLVQQALAANNLPRAWTLLDRWIPSSGDSEEPDVRGWEWRYLWEQSRPDKYRLIDPRGERIHRATYGAEGRLRATVNEKSNTIVYDTQTQQEVFNDNTHFNIALAHHSPLLAYTLAADNETAIHLYNVDDTKEKGPATAISGEYTAYWQEFTPDDRWLASILIPSSTRDRQYRLRVTNVETGDLKWERDIKFDYSGTWVDRMDISLDGKFIAYATAGSIADGQFEIRDLETGELRGQPILATNEISMAVCFSPDGRYLVTSGGFGDSTIKIWDANDDAHPQVGTLVGHRGYVSGLVFTRDGKYLLSSSGDYTIRKWDWEKREPAGVLRGHQDEVDGLELGPNANSIISRGKDGSIYEWDVTQNLSRSGYGTFKTTWDPDNSQYFRAEFAFSPDSRQVIERSQWWRGLVLWDVATLTSSGPGWGPEESARLWNLSADGSRVLMGSASAPESVSIVDVKSGKVVNTGLKLESPDDPSNLYGWERSKPYLPVAFPAWNETLFAGSAYVEGDRFRIQGDLWNLASDTGKHRSFQVTLKRGDFRRVNASWVNQETLAFTRGDGVIGLININEPKPVLELLVLPTGDSNDNSVGGFAVAPDGKYAAAATFGGYIYVWDWETRQLLRTIRSSMQGSHSVAFSPDGKRFAAGSDSSEAVKLFDTETWDEVLTLSGEGSRFSLLLFSRDSRHLFAVNEHGNAHLWSAKTYSEIEHAQSAHRRQAHFSSSTLHNP